MVSQSGGLAIIIPARYDASRFPGKLLELAGNITILEHTWRRACQVDSVDTVAIATDSDVIAAAADLFSARVIKTGRHPSGTDRIAAAIEDINPTPRWVVNVQGDEPLINPATISALCQQLQTSDDEIVTCATPFASAEDWRDPSIVKAVCDASGRALYFSRSPIPATQKLQGDEAFNRVRPLCLAHIGMYGYPVAILKRLLALPPSPLELAESLEQLRALEEGITIRVIKVQERSISVDTPQDLARVRQIMGE